MHEVNAVIGGRSRRTHPDCSRMRAFNGVHELNETNDRRYEHAPQHPLFLFQIMART
jgi:hypothetical protein